jgi:hypothetical protein
MLARSLSALRCGVLLILVAHLGAPLPTHSTEAAVAIVSSLTGKAQKLGPSGESKPVQLFDWLPAGTVIEVGASSRISLTYVNGSCYALEEGTRAKITAGGPEASSGKVSPLNSLPALPRLAVLANAEGTRPAATRIRGGDSQIRNMYPLADSVALPEETILRFGMVEDATLYRIDLQDETGRTIFDIETRISVITVPAGVLHPDGHYHWRVRTVDRVGPAVWGEGDFSTLPQDDIHRRTVLRKALLKVGDAESLALQAELDRRLGLLMEAREEFRAALSQAPDDMALQRELTEIEAQLTSDKTRP